MTADAASFLPHGAGDLILHEGKTFHRYTDSWDTRPRHSVSSGAIKPLIAEAARHHRLVFRDIARSNDERTMIACIAPPGTVFGHTATVEKTPWARAVADALTLCALFNSFPFDWLIRQKAATHLSLYLLEALPVPDFSLTDIRTLADAALSLSGEGPADWALRATVDAIVAHAYGLDRSQYDHLLRSFSRKSYPEAPALCLAAFDRRQAAKPRSRASTLAI